MDDQALVEGSVVFKDEDDPIERRAQVTERVTHCPALGTKGMNRTSRLWVLMGPD